MNIRRDPCSEQSQFAPHCGERASGFYDDTSVRAVALAGRGRKPFRVRKFRERSMRSIERLLDYSPNETKIGHLRCWLASCHVQPLILDLSVRSIVSPFVFLMPAASAVFEFDRDALPWRSLLLRCSFRGRVSRLAGGKRLRIDVAGFVRPTPIVLDDRVSNMAHCLTLFSSRSRRHGQRRWAHLEASSPSCNGPSGPWLPN